MRVGAVHRGCARQALGRHGHGAARADSAAQDLPEVRGDPLAHTSLIDDGTGVAQEGTEPRDRLEDVDMAAQGRHHEGVPTHVPPDVHEAAPGPATSLQVLYQVVADKRLQDCLCLNLLLVTLPLREHVVELRQLSVIVDGLRHERGVRAKFVLPSFLHREETSPGPKRLRRQLLDRRRRIYVGGGTGQIGIGWRLEQGIV
mmetsp:Transcript_28905/g.90178  ORF Transcript_28905/g.90178 Transcript_28905/m.90178 type:complete len:201 (+) Transcript_28905:537-1139(+)